MKVLSLILSFLFNFVASQTEDLSSKILGGSSAILSSYPRCFTTIFVKFEDTSRRCGGCVISSGNRILTAASCVSSPSSETQSSNLNFAFGLTSIPIPLYLMTSIARPSTFDVNTKPPTNDLAVIKINRNAIKLPGVNFAQLSNSTESLVGKTLFTCGFGVRNFAGFYPPTLMCTTLTVVENEICFKNQTCPDSTTTEPVTVPDGIICTQNKDGNGVCHGDEGSPVFLSQTDLSTIVGVVSYVADRGQNFCGSTVVITQVGSFKTFVDGVN